MDKIRLRRGLLARISRELGLSRSTVSGWTDVPGDLVVQVETITGIAREDLRPDLYDVSGRDPAIVPGGSA